MISHGYMLTIFVVALLVFFLSVALAIMGGYGGLYMLVKMKSAMSGSKEEEKPVVVSSGADTGAGIPAIGTPEFDKFLDSEAFVQLLDSEELLTKALAE